MKKTAARVIAALLALILLFSLCFFLLPLTETVRRVPVSGSADWMKRLPDDFVLSDILIPGTHGSAAYGHPWKYAGALNEKLDALRRSDLNGWIVVDFATPQLAQKIYEANF